MATVWRRRHTCPHWLVLLLLAQLLRPCTSVIQGMSSVLEEVLEHGPLFDEMEDEAWWSGVDVIDTALRSWPEVGSMSDSSSLLAALSTGPMDDQDFCRFWQSNRMHSSSAAAAPPPLLPAAEACALMNRALAFDLSAGSSSVFLLPRLPPPPPVPPTLTELVKQLNQLGQLQQEQQTTAGNDDNECLLCQWATLNGTIDLLPNSGRISSISLFFFFFKESAVCLYGICFSFVFLTFKKLSIFIFWLNFFFNEARTRKWAGIK